MVNSDDPAYFGGYLNTNLIETSKALNLSLDEVKIFLQKPKKSLFALPKTILGSSRYIFIPNNFAPKQTGNDIYPPVEKTILIL